MPQGIISRFKSVETNYLYKATGYPWNFQATVSLE
jgi:hypothetical protein